MIPQGGAGSRTFPYSKKYFKLVSLICILTLIFSLVFIPHKAKAESVSAKTLVTLTNSSRASESLPYLSINQNLVSAARAKAQDMIDKDYFAHNSPEGITPWYWIKKAGYSYSFAGENLAIDFSSSSTIHSAWMASPSHRANILDSNFAEIGIAVLTGEFEGRNTIVVVQMFGKPLKNQSSFNNNFLNQNILDQSDYNLEQDNSLENGKEAKQVLSETKVEILIYPQNESFSFIDLIFPTLYLFKKLF